MGIIENLDSYGMRRGFTGSSPEARAARNEAERELANYDALAQEYVDKGEFDFNDYIDKVRQSVAEVLERASEKGADVSELTEQWMEIATRVIAAKNRVLG